MTKVTTAIIPVAGYGSRMLPVTKAVEKCMLPVVNRPVIDYVVSDCLQAGITNIIFVVGESSEQLKTYYGHNLSLEQYLRDQHKESLLPQITVPAGVKFNFVHQPQNGKYGSAVPVALASDLIEDDNHVLVLMGDDFIWNADGSSETARLIKTVTSASEAALIGVSIPLEEVGRYGVIEMDSAGYFRDIIEKPDPAQAPSNMINVSKYILPNSLLKHIKDYVELADVLAGEYYITEPINQWVQAGGKMRVHMALGEYLDGGNPASWLKANNTIGHSLGLI